MEPSMNEKGVPLMERLCRFDLRVSLQIIHLADRSWWVHQDSNLGPAGYEPVALTAELWTPGGGILSYLDVIAHTHRIPRGQDLSGGRVGLRGEHADLAEDLRRLPRLGALAPHGEEVARLEPLVVPEVDLDEDAVGQRVRPSPLRVHDEAVLLPAARLAEARQRGDACQRDGELRHRLQLVAGADDVARGDDDRAGAALVGADDPDLPLEIVVLPDDRLRPRMGDHLRRLDDDVDLAGDDAGRGAAVDEEKVALRAADLLVLAARVVAHLHVLVRGDGVRQRLARIAEVAEAVDVGLSAERHRAARGSIGRDAFDATR